MPEAGNKTIPVSPPVDYPDDNIQGNLRSKQIHLTPNDAKRLARLCGKFDENLKFIEASLNIKIKNRGNLFQLDGKDHAIKAATVLLDKLYDETELSDLSKESIHLNLQQSGLIALMAEKDKPISQSTILSSVTSATQLEDTTNIEGIQTRRKFIKPRGNNQRLYINAIRENDINFGIGPAGTGKTWLAVACAVEALEKNLVDRILLVRPAVEAGEKLGFLPGDLTQKIDPYLRPLYDALYEMLGVEQVTKKIEKNIIEVAPLAFMRGRTLNNSFIILDESQNTTKEQMKMFLTRIGFGSTAVITGDDTQIDLPSRNQSGLLHAQKVLHEVKGINFTHFNSKDVIRHPMVQKIVEAYAIFNDENKEQ